MAVSSWVLLYWVNHFLFFLGVYRHFNRRNDYLTIIKRYILPLSALMSIWGVYQFLTVSGSTIGWKGHTDWGRAEAMFAQANSLGGYLSIILVILLVLYLYEKNLNKQIFLFASFLLIYTTFTITYSRASWGSFIVSTCLFLFLAGRKHIKLLLPKLVVLLLGMIVIFVLLSEIPGSNLVSRVQSIVGENNMPTNSQDRLKLWSSAWKLALENPLVGTGVGTFHLTFHSKSDMDYSSQIWMAHNDYVQFLSEIGFFGTAAIVAALVIYLFYGFLMSLKLRRIEDLFSDNGLLVLGVYAASLSPVLHSIVDFDLRTSGGFALFLFLSSMVWHESEKLNITSPVTLKIDSKLLPYPLLKVILSLLALCILYISATTVIAEYYYEKALKRESEGAYLSGISYAKKAVIMNEDGSNYHEFLARNYLRYALIAEDSLNRANAASESEKEYLLAIERSRMISTYYLGLASLYKIKSELFDSVDVKVNALYEKAIYAYPANNYLRFKFAEIFMKLGRYDKAIESLGYTLGRGRRIKDVLSLLAEAYRLGGDAEMASKTIDDKLKEDPKDGFANFIKGNILVDLGNLDEAVTYYLVALDDSEGYNRIDVLKGLSVAYLNRGDVERVREYLIEILSERPNDGFSLELMKIIQTIQAEAD